MQAHDLAAKASSLQQGLKQSLRVSTHRLEPKPAEDPVLGKGLHDNQPNLDQGWKAPEVVI